MSRSCVLTKQIVPERCRLLRSAAVVAVCRPPRPRPAVSSPERVSYLVEQGVPLRSAWRSSIRPAPPRRLVVRAQLVPHAPRSAGGTHPGTRAPVSHAAVRGRARVTSARAPPKRLLSAAHPRPAAMRAPSALRACVALLAVAIATAVAPPPPSPSPPPLPPGASLSVSPLVVGELAFSGDTFVNAYTPAVRNAIVAAVARAVRIGPRLAFRAGLRTQCTALRARRVAIASAA